MATDLEQLSSAITGILDTDIRLVAIYVVVYLLWGIAMNNFGIYTRIAKFKYWWQIITCYIIYMIPVSLLLRGLPWYEQYAYGLFFMGILEMGGYTIKSSIAFDNNLIDKIFSPRNFTLAMTLFFASYFPLGNWAVGSIYEWLF
ncbi:MAG: hypothetical protein AAGG75_14405 [Bacteroidota bacterium]